MLGPACNGLCALVFLLVLGWTVQRAMRAPVYNWDMLGYMALALEWGEDDPEEVHRQTYAAARARLPERAYQGLIMAGMPQSVRAVRHRDPQAFTEHIAFYRGRVLYTLGLFALHRLGAPLADATWWFSAVSFGLTALLILVWVARHMPFPIAALVSLGLAHSPAMIDVAVYSTADAFSTLLTCAAVYLLVERRVLAGGMSVLLLTILTRPDTVILALVLLAALFLADEADQKPSKRLAVVWLLGSLGIYAALRTFSGHYGWWPLFWISFVQKEVFPSQIEATPDLGVYWAVLREKVSATLASSVFVYSAFGVTALFLWNRAEYSAKTSRHALVLGALLVTYLVRFLLFPHLADELYARFYAPLYVLVPLLSLSIASGALGSTGEARSPAHAAS